MTYVGTLFYLHAGRNPFLQ